MEVVNQTPVVGVSFACLFIFLLAFLLLLLLLIIVVVL